MQVIINIDKCSGCPHHLATPYRTSDSFERPEYWWCTEDDEKIRLSIKKNDNLNKLRYVAGYVEWYNKVPIPDWCPAKIDFTKKFINKFMKNSDTPKQFTRLEALEFVKNGGKITHQYFLPDEYLYYSEEQLLTEDGHNWDDPFWDLDYLEVGWSEFIGL